MLVRDYLKKLNSNWDRNRGQKVEVINRLRRLGYSLVDEVRSDNKAIVAEILDKSLKKKASDERASSTMHVAYPVAAPIPSGGRSRCPNCNMSMRQAILHNAIETDYCPNCKIVKTPE